LKRAMVAWAETQESSSILLQEVSTPFFAHCSLPTRLGNSVKIAVTPPAVLILDGRRVCVRFIFTALSYNCLKINLLKHGE